MNEYGGPMDIDNNDLRKRLESLESEVAALRSTRYFTGVRKRSTGSLWGIPLYDIAFGPDFERGEIRGHARGIIAIGDVATGLVAMGGMARGLVAVGGLALGGLALGGCSIGVLAAIGGLAVGGIAAGGAAVGLIAIGGGAYGYYAMGGSCAGEHILSATQRDPEAIRFFHAWIPAFDDLVRARGG